MKLRQPVLSLLAALLVATAAGAHHSFAMFDLNSEISLEGVVRNVEWVNPHIWINITLTRPDGAIEEWGIEAGATNTMMRQGWKRDSLKPDEKVKVRARPMRNGSHAASLISVTREDGSVLTLGAQGARVPY